MSDCPNCGRPTADDDSYAQRHDAAYCSPITSPSCWEWPSPDSPVHYIDSTTERTACGRSVDDVDVGSTDAGSATCPDCLARM